MSEYQYYEFKTIDNQLNSKDIAELQRISSRAQITPTKLTNFYNWGDFKGNPHELMDRWFDLHLYLASWGTRQLMVRVPKRLIDASQKKFIDQCVFRLQLHDFEMVSLHETDENLLISLCLNDEELSIDFDYDDGPGWLDAIAPLRANVLSGDLRLFYLIWLIAVQSNYLDDDEVEPLPGIGPINASIKSFAEFFHIDMDLIQAAGEKKLHTVVENLSPHTVRKAVASIPAAEKSNLLERLAQGDTHVMMEVQNRVRKAVLHASGKKPATRRTIAKLRKQMKEVRRKRKIKEAEHREAKRRQQQELNEKIRLQRLEAIRNRPKIEVKREIYQQISRRNNPGYKIALELISDLRNLAVEEGNLEEFMSYVRSLRKRHKTKLKFLERLNQLIAS